MTTAVTSRPTARRQSSPHVARVAPGRVRVYQVDGSIADRASWQLVDDFAMDMGRSLRRVLGEHGWRVLARSVPGLGFSAVQVVPIRQNPTH